MKKHDFKKNPEIWNSQLDELYWESPHQQIFEDFDARVIKVIDGDTMRVEVDFRDFDFPVRMLGTNAPEIKERGGVESRNWLKKIVLEKDVTIMMDRETRVGKWGRLLGVVIHQGDNINERSIDEGFARVFGESTSEIPNIDQLIK